MVRRYTPYYKDDFGAKIPAEVEEDEHGDFVDYLEYERLEEENTELRQAINQLKDEYPFMRDD